MITTINEWKKFNESNNANYDAFVETLINTELPTFKSEWVEFPSNFGNAPLTPEEKRAIYNDYLEWDGYGNPNETIWEPEEMQDIADRIPTVSTYLYHHGESYPGKEISFFDFILRLHLEDDYENNWDAYEYPLNDPMDVAREKFGDPDSEDYDEDEDEDDED